MGGGTLINEKDEQDEFVYQAVVSYLCPMKAAIGIRAQDKKEAEEIIKENFSDYIDFELISLEPATPEQINQLKGNTTH